MNILWGYIRVGKIWVLDKIRCTDAINLHVLFWIKGELFPKPRSEFMLSTLITILLTCSENSQTRWTLSLVQKALKPLSSSPEIRLSWGKYSILILAEFTDNFWNQHCCNQLKSSPRSGCFCYPATFLCFTFKLINNLNSYIRIRSL